MKSHYQVLIVGAGPVGLLLACSLKKSGIDVVVVEKRSSRSTHSKALSMNAASLALLRSLGVAERFERSGKEISDISIYWNQQRISHVDYRQLNSCYQHILAIPQPETERLLEEYFIELGGEIRRSVTLSAIDVGSDGINASFPDGMTLTCDYLVGCDGSHSIVRDFAGITFSGFDYGIDFYLFDAQVSWQGKRDEVHYFVDEQGFIIVIPLADGNHRFVLRCPREDKSLPSLAEYQSVLSRYIPQPVVIERVVWESKSQFYNRLASQYRVGNIFLAGDSCHLFSPIGGLGMNTGFQDAWNLAWKLTAVISQRQPDDLLDTYDEERRSVAAMLRDSTDTSTRLIARIDRDSEKICCWLPRFSNRQRARTLHPQLFSGLAQRYSGSSLIYEGRNLAGKYLPDLTLIQQGNRVSSYDIVDGENYHLIVGSENDKQSLMTALIDRHLSVYFVEVNGSDKKIEFQPGEYLLVRPDGFVAIHESLGTLEVVAHYIETNNIRNIYER
ncbi:FAD-dependent oxidoreductase [Xenorhabdus ehlersii]|uniref:2-polyprenyl-6-methoxyphenol hydroxylase-like FAD-dependent oxidoreductase n=1 Tax=Xenorhabdus ehlersii TaxID=290111 RepID=A0A2D0IM13_9GAMM|nr:FAD-dependent monooxygenase [Xenorhabdus ehlersii]PHM22817.1 monooxygenase family protein [Xenorhabdus ehlersii]RKE93119.1 2-polyprenyl-6-methoxyphenol hydroxylase-like FAD-dependent oxidoreductase [Xenorhabdus ehlersii]